MFKFSKKSYISSPIFPYWFCTYSFRYSTNYFDEALSTKVHRPSHISYFVSLIIDFIYGFIWIQKNFDDFNTNIITFQNHCFKFKKILIWSSNILEIIWDSSTVLDIIYVTIIFGFFDKENFVFHRWFNGLMLLFTSVNKSI